MNRKYERYVGKYGDCVSNIDNDCTKCVDQQLDWRERG